MEDRKWVKPVTIENARFHFKDFAGKRYSGQRSIGITLDPEFAQELIAEGWKVKHLEATEDFDEKYYITIKIKYGVDRNGKYRHPDIYMISGDTMTLLDEDTVDNLDQSEIENVDLTFTPNFYEGKITAYLSEMYVTIKQDHLSLKYARFRNNNNYIPDEDLEEVPFN